MSYHPTITKWGDGSGRDSYITSTHGGLSKDRAFTVPGGGGRDSGLSGMGLTHTDKGQPRYFSNGSGRDSYACTPEYRTPTFPQRLRAYAPPVASHVGTAFHTRGNLSPFRKHQISVDKRLSQPKTGDVSPRTLERVMSPSWDGRASTSPSRMRGGLSPQKTGGTWSARPGSTSPMKSRYGSPNKRGSPPGKDLPPLVGSTFATSRTFRKEKRDSKWL